MDTDLKRSFSLFMRRCSILLTLILCLTGVYGEHNSLSTADGSEEWGYVDVRPGAHMFWWLYKSPLRSKPVWPLVLWLQGGPGASGVGIGNFGEIGPLTEELLPRQSTWLEKADLLFVDSPVGAGFSYVDNTSLIPTKDVDVVKDLVTFLKTFFQAHVTLQGSPLFIVAESYGGKHATLLGLALDKAVKTGDLKIILGGVALGDSWISPVDFVLSWGPVLKTFSRVDGRQEQIIYRQAKIIESEVENGLFLNATEGWRALEDTVSELSNNVDFYNLLIDSGEDSSSSSTISTNLMRSNSFLNYGQYHERLKVLNSNNESAPDLESVMNGPIRKKLKIIPASVRWVSVSEVVFNGLENDFMKDVIVEVDELLSTGVNVTIYNGQVDLICATEGTEAWVQKLKWPGLEAFNNATRTPMYCNSTAGTSAFVKSYKNLSFYWILLAGHMVPSDQPCAALEMLGMITR